MPDPIISFWDETGTSEISNIDFGIVESGFEGETVTLRTYNNKDNAASILNALNVRLCAADDVTLSILTYNKTLVKESWLEGRFTSYNDTSILSEEFSSLGGTSGRGLHLS